VPGSLLEPGVADIVDTIGISRIGGREATRTQSDVNVPRELFVPVTTSATSVLVQLQYLRNFSTCATSVPGQLQCQRFPHERPHRNAV
jgi:hypothetical protein